MVMKKLGVLLDLPHINLHRVKKTEVMCLLYSVLCAIYYHSRLHPESLDLFTLRGVDCGQPQQILLEVRSDLRVRPAYSERSAEQKQNRVRSWPRYVHLRLRGR